MYTCITMNETQDPAPTNDPVVRTTAPATYLLTSNGDGSSAWLAPPAGGSVTTFGRATLSGPFKSSNRKHRSWYCYYNGNYSNCA